MIKELKEFMMRGNVVDMAVGVIVGGAFGQIVTSLVNDIVMPPIGFILHGVDFKDLKIVITEAYTDVTGKAIPEVTLNYGNFIQTVINFIIISTIIFFAIKGINSLRKEKDEEAPAPQPTKEELLLTEIRDILKDQK